MKLLQHVDFVMKSGVVYKNEADPSLVDEPVPTIGRFDNSPVTAGSSF